MKHLATFATLCLLLACSLTARADDNGKQRPTYEQIVECQCKDIVSDLKLDDAKAKSFTETYKSYQDELKAARDKYGKREKKKRSEMTDDEIEQDILNRFAMSKQIISVREKYYKKFRKTLSPRQIQQMYEREKKGYERMRNEMNKRKSGKDKQKQPHKKGCCDSKCKRDLKD
ncbi:MAG: hypothetical protein ACI31A_08220 [Candidatus Limisoma sp.]